MPWVKLDDRMPDHPKLVEAGYMAGWLFICGLCYAARYLTDGFIPAPHVRRLSDVPDPEACVKKLVALNLWVETKDGYFIHDYLEYNPSRKETETIRAQQHDLQASKGKKRAASANRVNGKFVKQQPAESQPPAGDRLEAPHQPKTSPVPVPVPVPVSVPQPVPPYIGANARKTTKSGPRGKPSLEECTAFAPEIDLPPPEASKFFDYYQSIGWTVGKAKAPMRDWRAAMRGWQVRWRESHPSTPPSKVDVVGAAERLLQTGGKLW